MGPFKYNFRILVNAPLKVTFTSQCSCIRW